MPNRPLYVSYVFMNDLKKSLESATARPDVVNLGFGFPGVDHDLTVASIEKGFSDSGTTFNIADIKDAQAQGTKVLASMGGWGFRRQMSQALGDFDHGGWFHTLADKIVLFVDKYGLDGIDIDMEFDTLRPATDDDVEAVYLFMHTLKKQLKHKLITYTIQTPLDKNDEIVKKIATALGAAKPIVDWINVMEYNSPSIGKSKNARIGDIERYVNDLHIPRDRLVLGLMPGFNDDLSECTSAKDVLSLTKYVLENHDGGRLRGVMTWYMNNDKPEYTGMASNGDVGKLIKNTLLADYSSTSFLSGADGAFSTEEDLPTTCPKPPSAGQCNGGDGTDDYTKKMKCKQCSSDAMCGDGGKCWKSVPKCPAPGSPTPAPTKAPTPSGGGGGGGYYCNWSHPSGPRCEKDDAGTKTSDECGDVCHGTCSNKASTCDPTNDACCPGLSCHHDATFGGLCVVPAGGDDDGSGPSPSPGGEGKTGCYVVQKGDSCARIAAHFKTQEGDIKGDQDLHGAACDDIRGDGSLWAGDKLTITQAHDNTGDMDWKDGACPICHDYYVRSGDTCYKIEAAWGGVYDGDITNSRGEHCPGLSSSLQVGEKLKICGGTPPGALAVGALRGRSSSSSSSGGAPVEWMALVARWGRRAVAAGQWR
jgi:chitinase